MNKLLVIPLLIMSACGILYGCAAVGTSSHDCLSRVAAAEVAITESYNTTTRLYISGTISKNAAAKALKATNAANTLTDNAKLLCETDEPKATLSLTNAASFIAQAKTFFGGH